MYMRKNFEGTKYPPKNILNQGNTHEKNIRINEIPTKRIFRPRKCKGMRKNFEPMKYPQEKV